MKNYKLFCFVAVCTIFFSCGSNSSETKNTSKATIGFKGQTLNLLCWEGYADTIFTTAFEQQYGVTIKATYFGSSDELISKLRNGGTSAYDIISPSSDMAGLIVESDFVEALDTKKMTQWDSLSPQLLNLPDVTKDGKIYGLPFTWGPDYLIYDADVVKTTPTSWNIFYDPKYKGKVSLWDDISNIYVMGQMAGLDKTDKSALYNMTEAQLLAAKDALIKLRPQVRKNWATGGELDNLFKNGEVVLAVGWPLTVAHLNKEGKNLKAVIPQEGATGWIDRLMITKESQHKDLAMAYLNYISQPETMAKVLKATNYNVANPGSGRYLTPDLIEIANASQFFDKLNFWQKVKDRKRYNEVWNEVKSGQ